ncbi:hypothetical protein M5D96_013515 [Drosophila gunungcola]|uniref:Fibrinogen C-terminal domain-containing protein n=1 Tax=Drosophila gunungcola TaxID=103775 RepID=A0A9P9YB65_9MUSC|nr:hypothetical protein M5D96_013515 [Drosophila gunungcola]
MQFTRSRLLLSMAVLAALLALSMGAPAPQQINSEMEASFQDSSDPDLNPINAETRVIEQLDRSNIEKNKQWDIKSPVPIKDFQTLITAVVSPKIRSIGNIANDLTTGVLTTITAFSGSSSGGGNANAGLGNVSKRRRRAGGKDLSDAADIMSDASLELPSELLNKSLLTVTNISKSLSRLILIGMALEAFVTALACLSTTTNATSNLPGKHFSVITKNSAEPFLLAEKVLRPLPASVQTFPVPLATPTDDTPRNCHDEKHGQVRIRIAPDVEPFFASCDQKVKNGGWMVIAYRFDGSQEFNKEWKDYKSGFGIGSESEKYLLYVLGAYKGDAGDSLRYHAGKKFTTYDQDNDDNGQNCARTHAGAWWYGRECFESNLFGTFQSKYGQEIGYFKGILWKTFLPGPSGSLSYVRMLIRPLKK